MDDESFVEMVYMMGIFSTFFPTCHLMCNSIILCATYQNLVLENGNLWPVGVQKSNNTLYCNYVHFFSFHPLQLSWKTKRSSLRQ